jgi:hypothetical protein
MMTVYTQDHRKWEFVLSEANGQRSRENGIVKAGQGMLKAGTVVQFDASAPTKLVAADGIHDGNGSLVTAVAGIIAHDIDATSTDVPVAYIARDAEVKDAFLVYPTESAGGEKVATIKSLKSQGIVVRGEFA